ncbi:hypothetical protein H6G04_21455 [Calothrix membranacea FACHB-236]|nr:hypothetical protein [Calothrix membranacea FACHB-236]
MQPLQPVSVADLQAFLDTPEQLLQQSPQLQLAVASYIETPRSLLEVLVNSTDSQVSQAASLHVNYAGEITENWQKAVDEILQQQEIGQNDRLAVELLKLGTVPPCFFSEWVPAEKLIPGLRNPHIPLKYCLQLLERLAQEPTLEPSLQVAESPETPLAVLEQLAGDLELSIRLAVKFNPSCPSSLLELVEGQHTIASDWNTDAQQLAMLAQSRWAWIRQTVAQNPNTPPDVLVKLASDSSTKIHLDVARNPSSPVAALTLLVNHFNHAVREAVAKHCNSSEELLLQLLPNFSNEIAQRTNLPAIVIEKLVDTRQGLIYALDEQVNITGEILAKLINIQQGWEKRIAKNPKCLVSTLELLANHADNLVRLEVARNPNTPDSLREEILTDLAALEEISIRAEVAAYEKTPAVLLELLGESELYFAKKDCSVTIALLSNSATPVYLRERLKQNFLNPPGRKWHDEDWECRMALVLNPAVTEAERNHYLQEMFQYNGEKNTLEQLAKNPKTPPHLLEKLAQSSNPIIRRYVAINLSTPVEILIRLTEDEEQQVRDYALQNPHVPILEAHRQIQLGIYQLFLAETKAEETKNAHKLMARRTGSPYALAQVVEKGDRNSKLTAARSNKTPIQVLQQLAKDADEAVRQAVSQNANLPLHNLLELARDPSMNVRSNLAYKPSHSKTPTPIQLLEILAQDESERIRARIAEHPDTPVEILVRLANDSSREVKTKLIANPNTPTTILNRLGLEENLVNQRNPNTPGIVLAQAVKSMSSKNLADFIKHPVKGSQMPAETLAQLATHTDSSVRYRVASHPNTPATVLRQLARDSYVATVRAVASNLNTSPETLEVLASHPDFTTRLDVVRNPNTPPRALSQIVQSTQNSGNTPNQTVDMLKSAFPGNHNDVLRSIAGNPRTPIEALEILARREFVGATPDPQALIPPTTNDEIMRSLAYNPSLTPQLLGIITQDPSVDVRVCLVRHPNLTEALWLRLAEDTAIPVREAVAGANNAPVSVLELLARDEQSEVRIKVATNSNTLIPVLELLASDENPSVRTAAASNPHLPETILTQLGSDEKVEVRRAVAQNPNTPAAIKQTLRDLLVQPNTQQATSTTLRAINRIYNPSSDDITSILTEYANSENAFVRLVSLLHPLTPPEILTQATQSASWLERYAVADNPATPRELRQQLTQDSNRIVRVAAKV